MMTDSFVHLHVHSEYSLVDGSARIKPLINAVAAAGMPAVALTDQSNLFALMRFYKAALAAGVKPLAGVDAWVGNPEEPLQPFRLLLYVQNQRGYRNLTELVSRSYREGQHLGKAIIDPGWLDADSTAGLIALSGARDGDVGRALLAEKADRAGKRLADWLSLFGDRFYLQLARTGRAGEEDYLHAAVDLAMRRGVPVVATNEVCFVQREDFQAHAIRVCIHQGRTLDDPRRPKNYSPEQYLRRPSEMVELFADIPEALTNTLELAKRCNLELTLGQVFLPDFPIPEDLTVDEQLRLDARKGLEWRMATILDANAAGRAQQRDRYFARLEVELEVIITMGFSGYFLIVADFIQWAKDQGIPVGPGRGSGAGSLVAYALQITDLDPLEHDLLFERFLNPERVSMPDFDIDFCMDNRDRVIDYVARKYGRESVSQIITFGSMAAKAVVRDVGRVLGHPYGFTDRIAKLVPPDIGMTLDKALAENEEFQSAYQTDEEVRELVDMARQLEGLARNPGKHAGGVVIAPGKLTDFTPLYCEPGGENLVTQFDKDDVEQAGLVKFDFLGLRNLTIIDWALKTVNAERTHAGQVALDIARIPMNDAASFELLKRGETTAVFQLESDGMKKLIKKLLPDFIRRHHCPGGPVSSRAAAVGHGRRLHRPQARSSEGRVSPPDFGTHFGVDLWRHPVSGTGDADRSGAGGLLRWAGADLLRRAMGKKETGGDGEAARDIYAGGARTWGRGADRYPYLRPDGEVRRLRLQQIAFRGLCPGGLPNPLAKGALPGGLYGGGAVVGHGFHRQGGDLYRGVSSYGARGCAPGRQSFGL